jgi:hypothetical protein
MAAVTEPVIAEGWQDEIGLADVLVLARGSKAWTDTCSTAFACWPGLAMVLFRRVGGRVAIATRDGIRLTVDAELTVDAVRIAYAVWSLAGQGTQPGSDGFAASGEG